MQEDARHVLDLADAIEPPTAAGSDLLEPGIGVVADRNRRDRDTSGVHLVDQIIVVALGYAVGQQDDMFDLGVRRCERLGCLLDAGANVGAAPFAKTAQRLFDVDRRWQLLERQHPVGVGVEHHQTDLVALSETQAGLVDGLLGKVELGAPAAGPLAHATAAVDHHHERQVGLLREIERIEVDRQRLLQRRTAIAPGPERVGPADHGQATPQLAHIHRQGFDQRPRHVAGRRIDDHHRSIGPKLGQVRRCLSRRAQIDPHPGGLERCLQVRGAAGVAGDEQEPRRPQHLAEGSGTVILWLGITLRVQPHLQPTEASLARRDARGQVVHAGSKRHVLFLHQLPIDEDLEPPRCRKRGVHHHPERDLLPFAGS